MILLYPAKGYQPICKEEALIHTPPSVRCRAASIQFVLAVTKDETYVEIGVLFLDEHMFLSISTGE